MAANYAFGPLEDDIIIKHRLLTRTTTTRGEPPLKKLQKKFTSFVVEVEKDEDNYGECEKLSRAFLQELSTFEIPLLKSKAVVSSNVREKDNFNELKDEINRQILQAQADIEELKKQLEESKIERKHKEECEAIRKLIAMQPLRSEIGCRCSFFFPPGRFGVLVRDLSAQRWCISSAIFAFCQTRLFNCADGLRNEFADMHRWTSHFLKGWLGFC